MKIPRIAPGNTQLQTQSQQTIRPEGMDTSGKGIAAIGQAVEGIGSDVYQRAEAARSLGQTSQANLYARTKLAEIDAKIANKKGIVDWNDISDVDADYKTIKSETSKLFSSKTDEAKFNSALDIELLNSQTSARATQKKIWAREKQGELVATRELNRIEFGRGNDRALQATLDLYDEFAAKDIIFPEEAAAQKIALKKEFYSAKFSMDTQTMSLDKVKEKVRKGEYKDEPKDREIKLNNLVALKNLEDREEAQDKVDTRYDLIEALVGGMDIYNMPQEWKDKIVKDDILVDVVKKAQKGTPKVSDANKDFVKAIKEMAEAGDQNGISKTAASAIYRLKDTNTEKLGALAYYARAIGANAPLAKKSVNPLESTVPATLEQDIKANLIIASTNAINKWARDHKVDSDTHARAITEFIALEKQGNAKDALSQILRKNNLVIHPEMVNYPEAGQIVRDPSGNLKLAFPTGELRPIAPKTVKPAGTPPSSGKKEMPSTLEERRKQRRGE